MQKLQNVKKIISFILCAIFLLMNTCCFAPALADTFYDFSDEAQQQFDAQNNTFYNIPSVPQITPVMNSTKDSDKTQAKNNITRTTRTPILPQPELQPQQEQQRQPALKGGIVFIPEGTAFQAVLQSSVSSESLLTNDTIAAVLSENWYYNNILIAPMGSILYGKAVDTKKAGFAYENGTISITFNEILTPKGDTINLVSNTVTVTVENKRAAKIAANVAGGTLLGVATGALSTISSDRDMAVRLAIGGGIGALTGILSAFSRKGEEAEIPAGTAINVRLIKSMNIVPYS